MGSARKAGRFPGQLSSGPCVWYARHMELHVSSKEAAATLDELLDRVSTAGDTVIVERDGRPVARLLPAEQSSTVGRVLTPADFDALRRLAEIGRSLNDGWAEAVEEGVRLANQPISVEDPWDR